MLENIIFHCLEVVAPPFVFCVGVVTVVDVKVKKMVKTRELSVEKLASNHKIKHGIKYKKQ